MGTDARPIVCIGDIHGYFGKLERLWRNLELRLGASFHTSTFIFLGDYCDRGPDTSRVLDFLCDLPTRYPSQKHVYLCGNHDLAFAYFLKLLPSPKPPLPPHDSCNDSSIDRGFGTGIESLLDRDFGLGLELSSTWDEFSHNEVREGWWSGPGYESMHVQGRRWAGIMQEKVNVKKGTEYQGSTYDAAPTFASYGLPHGDPGLKDTMPAKHKKFLQELVWVYEQDVDEEVFGFKKLIAVHAGLEKSKPVESQMNILCERDVKLPRVEPLSGRKNVWNTPPELAEQRVMVVSGHHGTIHVDELRLIIDEEGGLPHLPVTAIILPSREMVRDTDKSNEAASSC